MMKDNVTDIDSSEMCPGEFSRHVHDPVNANDVINVVVASGASRTICRYRYKGQEPFFDVPSLGLGRPKPDQRTVLQGTA